MMEIRNHYGNKKSVNLLTKAETAALHSTLQLVKLVNGCYLNRGEWLWGEWPSGDGESGLMG